MAVKNLTAEAVKAVPEIDVAKQLAVFAQSKHFLGFNGATLMMLAALVVAYFLLDFQKLSRR